VQELNEYLKEFKPQLKQLMDEIAEHEKRLKSEPSPTQEETEKRLEPSDTEETPTTTPKRKEH